MLTGSVAQHHAIVDAIERHDPRQARRAMERHLDDSDQLVTNLLLRGRIRGVGI